MLNIANYEENENQTNNEVSSYTNLNGYFSKRQKHDKCWPALTYFRP
jgi:hypothetical protein